MVKENPNRRIKYALFLDDWEYENGNSSVLLKKAEKTLPSEYLQEMDGSLFCPVCHTNLNRIPKEKDHFSNGRDAYFAHIQTYKHIKCDLRSTRPEGKRYETFEEAQKAIDDENLVIVSSFLRDKPIETEAKNNEYDETPVEDVLGPLSEIPISRHNGESFKLPSKISTVAGICRNFDSNIYKYYHFPNQKNAIRLLDLLRPIIGVEEEDENVKLYYGIIKSSYSAAENPKPGNIRMNELQCSDNVNDFYLKASEETSQSKGLNGDAIGRVVLVYGKVSVNGIGLCIEGLRWGQFALLPEKYNELLI